MKKQGFTLIELMVVIVIMGILAAVAVPKLFGMIAKSKASEVGPAAGTYVKLQDAYVAETNALGKWIAIGYKEPGGTNFTYAGSDVVAQNTCPDGFTASTESGKAPCFKNKTGEGATGWDVSQATDSKITDGWTAANNVKLNDCPAQVNWKISATTGDAASNTGSVTYNPVIVDATNCTGLTPHFTAIGQ